MAASWECPSLPMLSLPLRETAKTTFLALKPLIRAHYEENPDSFTEEIRQLDMLREHAMRPSRDYNGCSTLRRYFAQLHLLRARFPPDKLGQIPIDFVWKDAYTGADYVQDGLQIEQASILFNIAALHAQLGSHGKRDTEQEMKEGVTHFQCAAGALSYFDEYLAINHGCKDLSPEFVSFYSSLMLGQAQECLVEKSLKGIGRVKNHTIARLATRVSEYYSRCVSLLEGESCQMIAKKNKDWPKLLKFKVQYFQAISHFYQGAHSEEMGKYGEMITLTQLALQKLGSITGKPPKSASDQLKTARQNFADHASEKLAVAKRQNDQVYHEPVPQAEVLELTSGADLVKPVTFHPTDPKNLGTDIFARLIPMRAHEVASILSEEQAKLMRSIMSSVEEKDEELEQFMKSLSAREVEIKPEGPPTIPDNVLKMHKSFKGKAEEVKRLHSNCQELMELSRDVSRDIVALAELKKLEKSEEEAFQEQYGPREATQICDSLWKEMENYAKYNHQAIKSNSELKAMFDQHYPNLVLLSSPIASLQATLPKMTLMDAPSEDASETERWQQLLNEVDKMQTQRQTLFLRFREQMGRDNVVKNIVGHLGNDQESFLEEQMKQFKDLAGIIRQNLSAQENILGALMEANAKKANMRQSAQEITQQQQAMFASLMKSGKHFNLLQTKIKEGIGFYQKLQGSASRLRKTAEEVCEARKRERQAMERRRSPVAMDTSAAPPPVVTPPHPPKKAELAGKPLPPPDHTHLPAQPGAESSVHTVSGTESELQQNEVAITPSSAHLNTMEVLQRIQQQQLQFQQQQQKRQQQQQQEEQQEQTMLTQLHTPHTGADRSPSSHAAPDSNQEHPHLPTTHPGSVPDAAAAALSSTHPGSVPDAATAALSSLQLLMQPGHLAPSTTSSPPPTTHTHPSLSASHGSVSHGDSAQGPHRPPKPSHLKSNPLPSPFPMLPASVAFVDSSAVTMDQSGGGGGGSSDYAAVGGGGDGGGGGGGEGGLVERTKGESLESSLAVQPPFPPSVPEAIHGSIQVSTLEPCRNHSPLPPASLPENVTLPEPAQTLPLHQPPTASLRPAEPSAPYYNPNINIQPGEITLTTSCILGPIPSVQAVPTSPEALTTLTSTHLMTASHKGLSGGSQPATAPTLPMQEVPASGEFIPNSFECSTSLNPVPPPVSTPQPIQQAPPSQSPPNPSHTDTQSAVTAPPGSIPVDYGGVPTAGSNQQPSSSTTPVHAETATITEIKGPDVNQEVLSSAELVPIQTLQSLSQSEPQLPAPQAVPHENISTMPSVTTSAVLSSLNATSGQELIQASSSPLLGSVGTKPLTDLPRVMPLSMTTLASLDVETPTPATSLAGELPIGAMSLQLSGLMAPQQLLQHSIEEQKGVIEVQREEIEMHKSQIADYRQQISQLQQQLNVLQQKQDHEKATASGQQNTLMQLLQQQQGIFSQQQGQIEKLSKQDETHRKEHMEVEARYRETLRNEQEMKSSLQSQNLQLMQENQKLNQVIQTQGHQVQTLQLQLQQYSVHIQERDKQLLAFKDQHKQIVDKQEEKHKQKITQLLQRLQERERGQVRDAATSLPHPLQPVVMSRNPQSNLGLGPTISQTNLPPPMQPNVSKSHTEKFFPPLQHQGSIPRGLSSPLQQISSQSHLPTATPVTLPMHPPSSQPVQQHGIQSPQQQNVQLMRQPSLQSMQSHPLHQTRPPSTGPVPIRPPSTGPIPPAAATSSPVQWTGYGGGPGSLPPSQSTSHPPPPQFAPIKPQQQQQQQQQPAQVLPQAQYTRGSMPSNIQPGGAQQHTIPPSVQHGGGATTGHFTHTQVGPNSGPQSLPQAPGVPLATRPHQEPQASYPGQNFPQTAGIRPQQPARFVGGPDGQMPQYRPATPQQAMMSSVPQPTQVFPQRYSAGPLGQNLPQGQGTMRPNFPQGAPPGQIHPQAGVGGKQ